MLYKGGLAATALLAVLVISCISSPVSSAADGDGRVYGTTSEADYDDIDQFFMDHFSMHITDMLQSLAEPYGYTLNIEPYFEINLSIERTVTQDTRYHITEDHVTSYATFLFEADPEGNFPAEGTYEASEGETALELLLRTIATAPGPEKTQKHVYMLIDLCLDISLETTVNLTTGEIEKSDLEIKLVLDEKEDLDLSITFDEDEAGNTESMTVSYDHHVSDGDFYIDLGVGFEFEGLRVMGTSSTWEIDPVLTEHLDFVVVSADLADSIWASIVSDVDLSISNRKLPELVIRIMDSSNRMMDLIEVIESLTSTEIPDISFTSAFNVSYNTDAHGYNYARLVPVDDDTTHFDIPNDGYTLDLTHLVAMIPSYIVSDETKLIISLAIAFIGWNDIEVKDITDDPVEQHKCSEVHDYVDSVISSREATEHSVPTEYMAAAAAGLAAIFILAFLSWRRKI